MREGHLASRYTFAHVDDLVKSETSEILGRSGLIGACDAISSLYIQKQEHPGKRYHLAALMDSHKDDQSTGNPVTCLGH